jgi:pyroglutamyl-peptidase
LGRKTIRVRILLTAFEPFDGTGLNASLEGCRAYLDRAESSADVAFAVLPVRYGADTEAVLAALARYPADLLLHTGQAGNAAEVRVERIAVNVRYGADAPVDEQELIDPEGPPALFSTLPVTELAAAIRAAGVPAKVSNHAGIYLCNHVLYQSLLRGSRGEGPPLTGFLHVPCLPEQRAEGDSFLPSMPAEQIGAAIAATVDYLRRSA